MIFRQKNTPKDIAAVLHRLRVKAPEGIPNPPVLKKEVKPTQEEDFTKQEERQKEQAELEKAEAKLKKRKPSAKVNLKKKTDEELKELVRKTAQKVINKKVMYPSLVFHI